MQGLIAEGTPAETVSAVVPSPPAWITPRQRGSSGSSGTNGQIACRWPGTIERSSVAMRSFEVSRSARPPTRSTTSADLAKKLVLAEAAAVPWVTMIGGSPASRNADTSSGSPRPVGPDHGVKPTRRYCEGQSGWRST